MGLMTDIHRSETGRNARPIRSILKNQPGAPSEAGWFYCYQCGFPNQKSKITLGASFDRNASLIKTTAVTLSAGGTSDTVELDDSASGGCRFCHSMNALGTNKLRLVSKKKPRGY